MTDPATGTGGPRRNRVDPWGDLQAITARGLFTGNRGCLVDDAGQLVRHHNGSLWIACQTEFQGWKHPLAAPHTWTPLFFLDDAVALAAGHRPCALCRRAPYNAYRDAVSLALDRPVLAAEINRRLSAERLRRGRGLNRAADRITSTHELSALPTGTVVIDPMTGQPHLVTEHHLQPFAFDGWRPGIERPPDLTVQVLTPATSVAALSNGFTPHLHPTALSHQAGLSD